ncbi:MAG: hypothetical protein AAGB14_03805 [Verrucomicrobiota bacterium]
MPRLLLVLFLALSTLAQAEHVIVAGGPSLRKWEDLRVKRDQHDRWWANFIRASTLRMVEIRKAYGKDARIVWMVHRDGYRTRSAEDGKPYTTWISDLARKRNVTLIWFDTSSGFISKLNNRPKGSIRTFDFFGHSNKYCFMFDYGNDIMAASTVWLHENDLSRIKRSIFAKNAYCKSWGCHTGESMSKVWKRQLGVPLEGAKGATDYTVLSQAKLPVVKGSWVR